MRYFYTVNRIIVGLALTGITGPTAFGQIVINEIVVNERTAGSGTVTPDTREFVELYNAGTAAVDLTGWTLGTFDLVAGAPVTTDTIPSGTIAPGDYFVIGAVGVPNVDFSPIQSGEIFLDNVAHVMELKNGSGNMVDAVAYEVFRTAATGLMNATAEQLAQIGDGFQGQVLSMNATAPNVRASWSRYLDGRDTNSNGRDFGMAPLTPGASNNLPQNASHAIPDVDSLATGTALSSQYHASFVLPRVIEPMTVSGANPRPIPESPQGGKAIVAWDETGGGNTVHSKELVNKFDLYAYFDTTPLGVSPATTDREYESSAYGIGSADPFYGNPDPTGTIPDAEVGPITQNASTGIGWVYQQFETDHADDAAVADFSKLFLVDFGDGGNSEPSDMEWEVIQELDLSDDPSGWYRLGIDYDPATGAVVATFGSQTFNFMTDSNLVGSFFVGYREGITDEQNRLDTLNPPIYDLFESTPAGITGDYNNNGTVDAADYVVWRKNAGTNNSLPNNSLPGPIGQEHYDQWRANFGKMAGGAAGIVGGVPEPGSVALLSAALMLLVAPRKRQFP
jgi:hypothetical protein